MRHSANTWRGQHSAQEITATIRNDINCYGTPLSSVLPFPPILHFTLLSLVHERRYYGQHKKYRYEYDCRICVFDNYTTRRKILMRKGCWHAFERLTAKTSRIGGRHDYCTNGRQLGISDEIRDVLYSTMLAHCVEHRGLRVQTSFILVQITTA